MINLPEKYTLCKGIYVFYRDTFIDTLVEVNQTSGKHLRLEVLESKVIGSDVMNGCGITDSNVFGINVYNNGIYYGDGTNWIEGTYRFYELDKQHLYYYDAKNGKAGIKDVYEINFDYASPTVSANICLFGYMDGAHIVHHYGVIHGCKIYYDDQLIRDYVPCVDPTGIYGLYDTIGGIFYSGDNPEYIRGITESNTSFLMQRRKLLMPSSKTSLDEIQYDFPFKAEAQSVLLSRGMYKLEVWGAQGGVYSNSIVNSGGYASGIITLQSDTQVFVYTGGQPDSVISGQEGTITPGGFNGGGASKISSYLGVYTYGQGGGGGTDIRINKDSLYNRVIVAGGGAGASDDEPSYSLYGGGDTGGNGFYEYGGSQVAGGEYDTKGTFGEGADALPSSYNYKYIASGGGGGWYGGGASYDKSDSNIKLRYCCGGGSGFVWTSQAITPSGYNLAPTYFLTNTQNKGGDEEILSPSGELCFGNKGNGYARITKLDNNTFEENITWSFLDTPWVEYLHGEAVDGKQFVSSQISDGESTKIRCTFKGVNSITFYCYSSNESNYDYLTVGELDTVCTRSQYKHKVDNYSTHITYNCNTDQHYVEFCYSKDDSQASGADQAEIFISSYT